LRRVTHYDYWSDSLKPSILIDSHADMGVYGMGEIANVEIAKALDAGKKIDEITDIPQTFFPEKEIAKIRVDMARHQVGVT